MPPHLMMMMMMTMYCNEIFICLHNIVNYKRIIVCTKTESGKNGARMVLECGGV